MSRGDFTVKLFLSADPGIALAAAEGPGAAAWAREQGTVGSAWWQTSGSDFAYAGVADRPGLPDLLRAEGYEVEALDYEHPRVL
jgi:hypothetical protein